MNAVKLGAVDYLAKPVDADDVAAALLALDNRKIEPPENPMSADRVRWEHIQRIYELCGRNVSETARRLNMHRRTCSAFSPSARRNNLAVCARSASASVYRPTNRSCRSSSRATAYSSNFTELVKPNFAGRAYHRGHR